VSGYLLLADGSHRPVHDGFVIGRVAGCDLVIDDSKASRRHARLVVDAGVVEVEDLESSNGTLLNEKPVTRRVLRDGDRVKIGKTELVYREGAPPGAARPAKAGTQPNTQPNSPAVVKASPPAEPVEPPRPVILDDDDDLLGDAMLSPSAPAPKVPAEPPPRPPIVIKEHPARRPDPAPAPTEISPPPPPPKPAMNPSVVEFADEVVEVRRPAPPPAAANKPKGPAPVAAAPTAGRILQYSKQAGGQGGVLGDDFGQIGGGTRWLVYLGALALAVGLVWLTMRLVG
jgi:predicted component of type VI protein secretion system